MARPLSRACRPRFRLDQVNILIVHGDNFGNAGDHVQVTLDGGDGYQWTPSPAQGTVLADTHLVRVSSTPSARNEIGIGPGGGDLTITVTSGGVTSNSQVQPVYYDDQG